MNEYLDVKLNNKFYLKIIFEINNDKVSDCIEIIKNIKMDGITFTLPEKSVVTDNTCNLSISTKVGTRVENISIKDIKKFTDNIKTLQSISEIIWAVYDENDNKLYRYEYDAKLDTEEFDAK